MLRVVVIVVVCSRNLRLWTHTFLAGSILAFIMGLLPRVTLVPAASGWEVCWERFHPQALDYYGGQGNPLQSMPIVLWLWLEDLFLGMRFRSNLVRADSIGEPTCICALSTLGSTTQCATGRVG